MPAKTKQQEKNGTQERVAPGGKEASEKEFARLSVDYNIKNQQWRDAQEVRDVRLVDLVRAHDRLAIALSHKPLDELAVVDLQSEAAAVSKAAADAVRDEHAKLVLKQDAKKSVDTAWKTFQDFIAAPKPQRMVPDDEADEPEE